MCIVVGFVNIVVLAAPNLHSHLARALGLIPGVVENAAVLATTLAGILLIFLGGGLARRKRRAWLLAVFLLTLSLGGRIVALGELHTRALLPLLATIVLLAFLLIFSREFYALHDVMSYFRIGQVLVLLFLLGSGLGVIFAEVRARAGGWSLSPITTLTDVWLGFLGIPTGLDMASGHDDDLVYYALLGIGAGCGLILSVLLLRSPRGAPMVTEDEHGQIRGMVENRDDQDSLAYFALRAGKSVIWSNSKGACMRGAGSQTLVHNCWPSGS